MSVLIKGMEMPKTCGDCPIGDTLCCSLMPGVPALWKEYTLALRTNRRHEECPLVPVPPHGDLVDRDEMFVEFVDEGQKTTRYKVGEKWELNGEEIRRVIQRLPAVITAEEATQKDGGQDEAPAGPYDLLYEEGGAGTT